MHIVNYRWSQIKSIKFNTFYCKKDAHTRTLELIRRQCRVKSDARITTRRRNVSPVFAACRRASMRAFRPHEFTETRVIIRNNRESGKCIYGRCSLAPWAPFPRVRAFLWSTSKCAPLPLRLASLFRATGYRGGLGVSLPLKVDTACNAPGGIVHGRTAKIQL